MLHRATNEVCDELVNEVLIRFCASFLDQGYANWPLPDRENGFFAAFVSVYGNRPGPPDRWLRGLHAELDGIGQRGLSPLESIEESLRLLGVSSVEREQYLLQTLQALPGWGGMIWQMETNAEWTLRPAPAGTLVGFLAVRLILDRLAVAHAARQSIGWTGSLGDLRAELRRRLPATSAPHCEQRAFLAFQLSQVCGWLPQQLQRLPIQQWQMLMRELDMFSNLERRRVLHRAYERRYRNQVLDALIIHSRDRRSWAHESAVSRTDAPAWRLSSPHEIKEVDRNGHATTTRPNDAIPSFQIITCIDDREESFRRHLEEIDPACETFGAAGFFGVAMYYRGASDAHPRPLCPVIIKPQHYVNEEVEHTFVREHKRRAEMRRVLGTASHQVHLGSRTFFGGLLTGLTGTLASIPLVTRILFPRSTAQLRSAFAGFLRPPTVTKLALERSQPTPGPEPGHVGYSLDEMSNIVERLLRDIGLLQHFAPIVVMCGHGSSSLNNPHESAYNCGACSGGRGGPNARAFAEMANDPRVRNRLSEQGLNIPNDSVFVGAYHNTCDDSVTFFDLERVPVSHRQQFQHICDLIDEARRRDGHERCRRFESAPLSLTPEAALKHVEGRSEDLSQARPEYNHATNALCLVGHRWWSRNLFLDRRAFLQSY
ncbi:MAG: DUF2309 family protein, partial [Planctomycetales bacterium]|nr:DUF2309 family protein [Planctomycetales bacterium]